MSLQERINVLLNLKIFLYHNIYYNQDILHKIQNENKWFIPKFVQFAIQQICENYLNERTLHSFINKYSINTFALKNAKKTVGIIAAGNIPLVSFHDILCSFLCGFTIIFKPSSKDKILTSKVINWINSSYSSSQKKIIITPKLITNADKYLLTGSASTYKIFSEYFPEENSCIRKNMTSVCILHGNETKKELEMLCDDIILYFGLGCRNVSHLFIPKNYNLNTLLQKIDDKYSTLLLNHNAYKSNLDFQIALNLINKQKFIQGKSFLFLESKEIFSPISVAHFSTYNNIEKVYNLIEKRQDIQTIISKKLNSIGTAQKPSLFEFADKKNTIVFLVKKL